MRQYDITCKGSNTIFLVADDFLEKQSFVVFFDDHQNKIAAFLVETIVSIRTQPLKS